MKFHFLCAPILLRKCSPIIGTLLIILMLLPSLLAQDMPDVKYPTAIDTPASLFQVSDRARTALKAPLSISDTTATVESTATFPPSSYFVVNGGEIAYYSSKDATHFYGLVRAREGTIAASAIAGSTVEQQIIAVPLNAHAEAIRRLQLKLGKTDSRASLNAFLVGNGQNSTAFRLLNSSDISTALGYTPADSSLGIAPALTTGGVTDNSAALQAAITSADSTNSSISLNGGSFALKDAIPGSAQNVTVSCPTGDCSFKKIAGGSDASLLTVDAGTYKGWRFEGIEFDGNARNSTVAAQSGISFNLSNADGLTFIDCSFRDMKGPITGQGSRGITFIRCKFFGTAPGVMTAGVQNPSPNASAVYRTGAQFNDACSDILFDDCDFHFCEAGIVAQASYARNNVVDSIRGIHVINCRFRGDWFNNPYKTHEWVASAQVGTFGAGTVYLDISSGSFAGFFDNTETVCFPVQVSAGGGFTSVFSNVITVASGLASAQVGDVIETSDGKRAEVVHPTSSAQVEVAGWESIDTFERSGAPALSATWKLMRYYATTAQAKISTTRIQLYQEPVNMFTGHRMLTTDGLTLAGRTFRTFAKMSYSGTHISHTTDVLIEGNYYRGSWADQISNFYCRQLKVIGNTIEMGQDEAITVTTSPNSIIANNTIRNEGVGLFVGGGSRYTRITGNTFHSWNLHLNSDIVGAIQTGDRYMSIEGNTFDFDPDVTGPGYSTYAITLYNASCSGSVVSGNSGSGALGQVYADSNAGSPIVRDMAVAGDGAASVRAGAVTDNLYGDNLRLPFNGGGLLYRKASDDGDAVSLRYTTGGLLRLNALAEINAFNIYGRLDPSNPIATFRLSGSPGDDGNIGFGTASPAARLHAVTNGRCLVLQQKAGGDSEPTFQMWDENGTVTSSMLNGRFRLYKTNSGAASDPGTNHESFELAPVSNVWTFTSAAGGTGTLRNFNFAGGKVGINSTGFAEQFAVGGNITLTGQFIFKRTAQSAGATVILDFNTGNVQEITLTANTTVSFTNIKDGAIYHVLIKENATGGFSVTWPASAKFPAATPPAITTAANAVSLITFISDGTNLYMQSSQLDLR